MTSIIVSPNAGFCMGVNNAFEKAIELSFQPSKTAILGDIVHNRFAVDYLKQKGLNVKQNVEEIINDKSIVNVVIRAHGIDPSVENRIKESGKTIYDMTCPIVKKVQLLAQKLTDEGHSLIIYGKKNHPEVMGIIGYTKGKCLIVGSINEIENIDNLSKPALICQTTMNVDEFEKISSILINKFTDIAIYNTLCKFPIRMQESALELAANVSLMVVVGDKNSSNTKTLYNRVREITNTLFIENPDEITTDMLTGHGKIGVAGGSSTPEFQIGKVQDHIEALIQGE